MAWEAVLLGETVLRRTDLPPARRTLILTGVTGLAIVLAPPRPEGEMASREEARNQAALVTMLAKEVQTWAPGPVFTDNSAVCWLTDRRGVWRPYNEAVELEIRRTLPGMAAARWVRLPGVAAAPSQPADP